MNYFQKSIDDLLKMADEKGIKNVPRHENGSTDHKFLARMLTQYDAEQGNLTEAVEIPDDEEEELEAAEANTPKKKKGEGWVDVVFHNQDGQPKYVYLGLNGRSLYLPREVPVRIPVEFMNVVRSSVQTKIVQTIGSGNKRVSKSMRVPRFSYEVLKRGK